MKKKTLRYSSFLAICLIVAWKIVSSFTSIKFLSYYKLPTTNVYDELFYGGSATQKDVDETPYADELGPLNIVIFYPDDWRYDAIEDAQPDVVHTPFLTKLAKDGLRFTHNAVTTSICWISRATLFTGRYASQHKSERLYCPVFTMPSMWNGSWPYMLQKYGNYIVGHIGKWQYRNKKASTLFNFSYFHEGAHWYVVNKQRVHANSRARDDAITFLQERPSDRNFALTVAFYPPKPVKLMADPPGAQWSPTQSTEALYQNDTFIQPYNYSDAFAYVPDFLHTGHAAHRYGTRFNTSRMYQESMRHYYALVTGVDEACRDIVAELYEQGILNRTMIIVSADNGMMLGAHGLAGKWHPYQESIRVPLIIYDPRMAKSKRGTTDNKYTLNIDLAPTITSAANIKPDPRMQGRDLADIYVKKEKKITRIISGSTEDSKAKFKVETNPWREDFYYEFPLGEFPASTALVTKQYKYIRWNSKSREQIFDLQNDPYELHDLMTQDPPLHLLQQVGTEYHHPFNVTDLLAELRVRHNKLEAEVKEPFPGDESLSCQSGLPFP